MGNYYSGMMNATGGSELRHHGILGQKWGVRRYQNADGTLTEAGKERYYGGGSYEGYEAEAKKIADEYNRKTSKPGVSVQEISKAEKEFDAKDAVVLNRYLKTVDDGVEYLKKNHDAQRALRESEDQRDVYRFDQYGLDKALEYAKNVSGSNADRPATLTDGSQGTVAEALADQVVRESIQRDYDERAGKGAYQKLVADTDYEYSPYFQYNNQDSKWDFEREILSYNEMSRDEFSKLPKQEADRYSALFFRMASESGDYYSGTPVTTAFDKAQRKIHEESARRDKIEDRAAKAAARPYEARVKELDAQYKRTKMPGDEAKWLRVYEEMRDAMWNARKRVWNSEEYKNSTKNIKKYKDELVGVVLRDIGYTDNPEARRMAYSMVFWD